MISKKMQEALVEQINAELFSAYLYLAMAAQFEAQNLKGMARWMEVQAKEEDPTLDIRPMTLEGCVVRMADTISYVGRDIEDAIRLGLIVRDDLPADCKRLLGETNGTIVYHLVEDLVACSLRKPYVCFTPEKGEALRRLKEFNQQYIYQNLKVKEQTPKVKLMFELLFERSQ